jgi:hypothetical protein
MSMLAEIDLRGNPIGNAGGVALAGAFSRKPNSLVRLLLSQCSIDEEGVSALLASLVGQGRLELLGLSGNIFGSQGTAALVPALSRMPSLTELGIGNAGLSMPALTASLSNGAPSLKKLTSISLSGALDASVLKLIDPLPAKLSRAAADVPAVLQGLRALAAARGGGAKNGLLLDLSNPPYARVALDFASSLGGGEDGVRGLKLSLAAGDESPQSQFMQLLAGTSSTGAIRELSLVQDQPLCMPLPAGALAFPPIARLASAQAVLDFARAVASGADTTAINLQASTAVPLAVIGPNGGQIELPEAVPDGMPTMKMQLGQLPPQTPGAKTVTVTYSPPVAAYHALGTAPVANRCGMALGLADLTAGRNGGASFDTESTPSALTCLEIPGTWSAKEQALSYTAFGPPMLLLFRLGLEAPGCRLTSLDVGGNRFGNDGAEALGRALRVNRTLTKLRMDDNGVGTIGLKAIRGALYGNQKLSDLLLPDNDIAAELARLGETYLTSIASELQGRSTIKHAYAGMWRSNPPYRPAMKDQGLKTLVDSKKLQASARSGKDGLRKLAAQIAASIKRNVLVAKVKKSAQLAKAQAQAAAKALALASQVKQKAEAKKRARAQKVWTQRHSLLAKWAKLAKNQVRTRTPPPLRIMTMHYDHAE